MEPQGPELVRGPASGPAGEGPAHGEVADGPWRTRRALTAEGVRQLVAVGVAYLLTTGPQLLDADWSMLWSMPLTMVALAVVVLVLLWAMTLVSAGA